MSTYKQIAGTTVKAYTTNPSDPQEGEMWYNQTTLKLRGVTATAAWSASASVITARMGHGGAGSTADAALAFGGTVTPFHTAQNKTEEYNGSGWSSGGNLNTARYYLAGCGTQTAGLAAGGIPSPGSVTGATEEYDGSSWTSSPNSMSLARMNLGNMLGVQTAAAACGGDQLPSTPRSVNNTEEYDGTSWTAGGALNDKVQNGGIFGTQTAGVYAGGILDASPSTPNTIVAASEEYDGSTWTNVNDINTARYRQTAFGTQTQGVIAGGSKPAVSNDTETYDGTTFSTSPATMATARTIFAGSQSSPGVSGVVFAGYTTALTGATEEYNFSAQVVTPGAWASGGTMNTARYGPGGSGTQTEAIVFGGFDTAATGKTEEYDGTSWTEVNDLSTARYYVAGGGTQSAAFAAGGRGSSWALDSVEEWDGTNWTAGTSMPTALNQRMGVGILTAGLVWGGVPSPGASSVTSTDEYDGSTWTSGGALPGGTSSGTGMGTQTAALSAGGTGSSGRTDEYNGSTWSDQSATILHGGPAYNFFSSMSGTQTAGMISGGGAFPGTPTASSIWDGSSWATNPSLGTARRIGTMGPLGTTTAGLAAAGQLSPGSTTGITEEFTPESTSANSVDITTAE